jgi:hypothetical protein
MHQQTSSFMPSGSAPPVVNSAGIRGSANAAGVRSAPKLAWSARRADGGEFTSSAPVATTAAEAALSVSAEATGRSACTALSVV